VRKCRAILIALLVVCAFCAAVTAQVAVETETPTITIPPPVTPEPVTTDTTVPTTVPTTEPTTVPTTVPTTTPTFEPTVTITIPTVTPTVIGGGKGYIDTYSNVDGASVSFDGTYQCTIAQEVCTVAVSPSGTPVRTITVTKSGYSSWSGPLPHMPADSEHVPVYATLNPVPTQTPTIPPVQTGTIYAQSSPAGAALYLNGNFYGYSPLTIPNLVPGSYSMKASLAGYTPDTRIIYVYAGQTAPYYPVLQQSPPAPRSTGTVTVTSNPDHALLYVDGVYQGKVPLTVTLYPGSHALRLALPGYNDYMANIYVNANTNQKLNAVMSAAVSGTVAVTSLPGATVYMDSTPQGNIPPSGLLTLPNIANGNHLFRVTAAGYNDWINSVYVQTNTVTPINAALTPVGTNPAPVPAAGGFTIVSVPSGAEVYVDNLFKGYTPATLTDIAAGQHQVLLQSSGYVDYSQAVAVSSGQTIPLAISLQPAPTPTPASASSPAVIIGGIVLALGTGAVLRRRS
jgi:PEGA domain